MGVGGSRSLYGLVINYLNADDRRVTDSVGPQCRDADAVIAVARSRREMEIELRCTVLASRALGLSVRVKAWWTGYSTPRVLGTTPSWAALHDSNCVVAIDRWVEFELSLR